MPSNISIYLGSALKKSFYFAFIKISTLLCAILVGNMMNGASAADAPKFVIEAKKIAIPLDKDGIDTLLKKAGSAKFVLLGESSHGTSQYYLLRTEISKRLIKEKGFNFIAIEGDWPYIYRVNQYVKGLPGAAANAKAALGTADRWPDWLWANEEFLELVKWLRQYNDALPAEKKVGLYGIDMQDMQTSIETALSDLEKIDLTLADSLKNKYECLLEWRGDFNAYARSVAMQEKTCEQDVATALEQFNSKYTPDNVYNSPLLFNIKQNILSVKYGEKYWRVSIQGGADGWNQRVRSMKNTIENLSSFYEKNSSSGKGIIWAHNTHIGDARATEMATHSAINIGQLLRTKYGENNIFLLGFATYTGQVVAARAWGAEKSVFQIPTPPKGSVESLLKKVKMKNFILLFNQPSYPEILLKPLGHRAIGVVYNPEVENPGNYVMTVLPYRYDALIFIEETSALNPLH